MWLPRCRWRKFDPFVPSYLPTEHFIGHAEYLPQTYRLDRPLSIVVQRRQNWRQSSKVARSACSSATGAGADTQKAIYPGSRLALLKTARENHDMKTTKSNTKIRKISSTSLVMASMCARRMAATYLGRLHRSRLLSAHAWPATNAL